MNDQPRPDPIQHAAPPALATSAGSLPLPVFLPDATRGVVRCLDAEDLHRVGVRAVMANSFHLSRHPGARLIQQAGGLHQFMGWSGPIVTDSGGYQVLSMIRRDAKRGTIRPDGVIFHDLDRGTKEVLTPAKSIQLQLRLGADVLIALDDCTGPTERAEDERGAVERTVRWFRSAKQEFDRQVEQRRLTAPLPLLVGVAQGGEDASLRRECVSALLELGADAIGFGGWPVDAQGRLLLEAFALVAHMVPAHKPILALGIGKPEHLVAVCGLGRRFVFDCSLPTRDARHHRLYVLTGNAIAADREFYSHVYVLDPRHCTSRDPISPACDCPCCQRYSLGYVHHLFKIKDALGERLATLHNLRFYTNLIERIAAGV
ncbi:MAG: tRNA guanosine(34) transglycosylase Tgt [Planctomycetota bacterium]